MFTHQQHLITKFFKKMKNFQVISFNSWGYLLAQPTCSKVSRCRNYRPSLLLKVFFV